MPHYFSEKQDSEIYLKKIPIRLKNMQFELYTAGGVFSNESLDRGTKVLIENAVIGDDWTVLDLGCGIGVVGISIKKQYPGTKVLMTDINERAILLSKKNMRLQMLEGIEARKSDIFSNTEENFDSILLNPPQSAGRELCFRMIEQSFHHLKPEGLLQLVARHKKGGAVLEEKMKEVFGNAKQTAKEAGYRVYLSERT